jgi:hypothetical protein
MQEEIEESLRQWSSGSDGFFDVQIEVRPQEVVAVSTREVFRIAEHASRNLSVLSPDIRDAIQGQLEIVSELISKPFGTATFVSEQFVFDADPRRPVQREDHIEAARWDLGRSPKGQLRADVNRYAANVNAVELVTAQAEYEPPSQTWVVPQRCGQALGEDVLFFADPLDQLDEEFSHHDLPVLKRSEAIITD